MTENINSTIPLSLVDIGAILLLLLGMIRGWWRGLSKELSGLIAWGVSLVLAHHYYPSLGAWLSDRAHMRAEVASASVFIILLLAVMLVVFILRALLGK